MIRLFNWSAPPCVTVSQNLTRNPTRFYSRPSFIISKEETLKLRHNKVFPTKMVMKTNGFVDGILPDELKKVLRLVGSEWGDVVDDMESLQVIPLKGAMTNEVFQINWPTKCGNLDRKLLVRIYGEGVEAFFNRDDEIRTFECMSKHGQGPRLLGRFADGRVEEFIHARTLSAADLRDHEISALVAAKMREFHNLEMPGPRTVLLWNRMRDWLVEAKSMCSAKCVKEFRLDSLEDEISMLEKELSHDYLDIGFCHNDLQYGNIMLDEETRSITLIDYEYASFNPVAYDLANHFCEMVANYHSETPHILDYNKYPGLEERRRFVDTYLSSAGKQPSEDEAVLLLHEVERYTLASHLFWGLWGIISGYVNKIDFDYMEYARQRFRQYWLRKKRLLGSPDNHVNGYVAYGTGSG
ncbi:choline kinase 3 isoform X1 [Populus alba x Populus x berolinensis]|uniref:Choline kinase 3 isoform X1 n=2 Tax=Populus alba x Populus x berolinensis TaxID=444605 RepID=A0AAD6QWY1_9ROSI|nr:choline kinase 3 isoform X1 [Populus alba x Populus x berolinensis]